MFMFVQYNFYLVSLFLLPGISKLSGLVGIQNTRLSFLLNSGVKAFMIPIDQSAPLVLWVINYKWVKY